MVLPYRRVVPHFYADIPMPRNIAWQHYTILKKGCPFPENGYSRLEFYPGGRLQFDTPVFRIERLGFTKSDFDAFGTKMKRFI
jgi:hypothetical protein